ncbi:hypothetical protein EW026_g1578 [Hermanssonia centrifuga]|uniref:C3H1-type domain-containing protein n=1 Tax=Hermanssonia centrifuga TaxID=98765 RepID=A0A4S4KR03_9APHY|nr:hypothetical protein EW026_g1578 [Hermanssonia centrifuga]
MDSPSTSAAAMKEEIARLTGGRPRNNVYVNPDYKPPLRAVAPIPPAPRPPIPRPLSTHPDEKRDVVINGIAFETSGRSLVRKDLAIAKPAPQIVKPLPPKSGYPRKNLGKFAGTTRIYKPKATRGRPMNRNMTLTNDRRPPGARRRKYVDKPCPRFNTTGACSRGLTCPYTHDANKIAICWPFLQGSCPNSASTCPLSHDPTPERTPLCVHFANAGRCTRAKCPYPHVKVGRREGVCRDFAVLGYCEKGLDCEHQHVRECPDFAEKGICTTKKCKLPHVIRANRNRPKTAIETISRAFGKHVGTPQASDPASASSSEADVDSSTSTRSRVVTAEDAQMGDEFISLTFHESESDDDDDESDEEEAEDEESEQAQDEMM